VPVCNDIVSETLPRGTGLLEIGASGSVGGEGGNILVYPASVGEQVPQLRE
jgi:hypothetical protein